MARAVGIDLGTTNSVVAVLEGGEPTVIANAEGSRTTPSVVAFAKNGEVLVGEGAKRQAVTNVDRTIRSVKRQMRTDWKGNIAGKKVTAQGGADWDKRMVDWLVQALKNGYGVDLSKDKMALQRLRESAEKAKIELSGSAETQINLPYITHSEQGPLHLDAKLTRAEFQKMTSDLLDRCKGPFKQVIADAGVKLADIHHAVLVGGSTH